MPIAKPKREPGQVAASHWYRGKQAKTGNSLGLRFDKALFQSHPEFNGSVQARVIAPGRLLVVAKTLPKNTKEEDPVIAAFLSFLAEDMRRCPDRLVSLDERLMRDITRLVGKIKVDPNEDLGDEDLV
jgi:hypothetical protein